MMKLILATAIITMFTTGIYAQAGMPKELTCTETAFNFSFSLGTKWKLSSPKMGPVGIGGNERDYIPAWSLKTHEMALEIHFLSHDTSYRTKDEPKYLLPVINFNPSINYKLPEPYFPVNSYRL